MATIVGTSGVVKLGAAAIASVVNFSLEKQAEVVEDTVLGQTAKTFVPDRTSWSGSISCQWDKSDATGQEAMQEGAVVTLSMQPEGDTSGDETETGSAIMTAVSKAVAAGSMVTQDFTFQGSGTLTKGAVA